MRDGKITVRCSRHPRIDSDNKYPNCPNTHQNITKFREVPSEFFMNNIVLKITALIFGIALWFFVMSQQDFQMQIDAPVKLVRLPEMLAVASKPPQTLPITVQGPAFDLIRLRADMHSKNPDAVVINIDLQNAELGSTRKHISKENIQAAGYPNVQFVEPSNQLLFIDLDLDTRIERSIPVHSNAVFETAPGYIRADAPKLKPEFVKVTGARNAITRIIEIPTDSVRFDSLTASDGFKVHLNFDLFPAYVTPSDSTVMIDVNIQKIASKKFEKVPVQLIGIYDKSLAKLSPDTVSVEISGGAEVLDSIKATDIELLVEINRFTIEDVDSLAPTVKLQLSPGVNRDLSIKGMRLIPEKVKLKKYDAFADTSAAKPAENAAPTDEANVEAP